MAFTVNWQTPMAGVTFSGKGSASNTCPNFRQPRGQFHHARQPLPTSGHATTDVGRTETPSSFIDHLVAVLIPGASKNLDRTDTSKGHEGEALLNGLTKSIVDFELTFLWLGFDFGVLDYFCLI